jgi:hypothetical protein
VGKPWGKSLLLVPVWVPGERAPADSTRSWKGFPDPDVEARANREIPFGDSKR